MRILLEPRFLKSPDVALCVQRVRTALDWQSAYAILRKKMSLAQARGVLSELQNPPGVTDPHREILKVLCGDEVHDREKIYTSGVVKFGHTTRMFRTPLSAHGRSIPYLQAKTSMQVRRRG